LYNKELKGIETRMFLPYFKIELIKALFMKLFLNITVLMLTIAWGISHFIYRIGPVAHLILLMAVLIVLIKRVMAIFYASFPYYTSDIEKRNN
jgi:hypothetical protein